MRNLIERLVAIRREKIVMGTVEFEKVTAPEPDQQTILDYLKESILIVDPRMTCFRSFYESQDELHHELHVDRFHQCPMSGLPNNAKNWRAQDADGW